MDFIEFGKGEQRKFLISIKEKSKISWPKLAKLIGKSRSTILAYLREDCKMPKYVFDKLNLRYNIKFNNIKIISLSNTKRDLEFPKISNKLSEFLGAVAGDGHLHANPAELSITCHAILDRKYVYFLYDLFQDLFNQQPTIILQKNVIKLRFYSKRLVSNLNKEYKLPIGKKKNRLHIPKQIVSKRSYLISFIRGLFDTDGTITRHHKKSGAILEIVSRDLQFLNEINKGLLELGFKTSLGYKGVKIYNKGGIHNFFKLIKPANSKHTIKYEIFKRRGFVPLNKEIVAPIVQWLEPNG